MMPICDGDDIPTTCIFRAVLSNTALRQQAAKTSQNGQIIVCPRTKTQDGTSSNDFLMECTLGSDGSIYLAGYTTGNWSDINVGHEDFAAAKLDADGNEIWRWQVRE